MEERGGGGSGGGGIRIRSLAAHFRRVVLSVQALPGLRLGHRLLLGERTGKAEVRLLVAVLAQVNRQRARIDAVDSGHAVRLEVRVKRVRGTEVRRFRQIADHKSRKKKAPGLDVLGVDSVVADFGSGEGDELPGVRRVGQDLLIPAHAGVEHHLATPVNRLSESDAVEDRAVRQRQKRLPIPFRPPLCNQVVVHSHKPPVHTSKCRANSQNWRYSVIFRKTS